MRGQTALSCSSDRLGALKRNGTLEFVARKILLVLIAALDGNAHTRHISAPRALISRVAVSGYSDLLNGVVVEILVVIARHSISLSRINIIFAGFFDNALWRLVPIGVVVEAGPDVTAGRGFFSLKLGVATKR
jgi:hypothetical protein